MSSSVTAVVPSTSAGEAVPIACLGQRPDDSILSGLYMNVESKKRRGKERVHLAGGYKENENVELVGEPQPRGPTKLAVGVKRKGHDGKMYIFPASAFNVSTNIKHEGVVGALEKAKSSTTTSDWADKRGDLITTFAPVKKKRQLNSFLANRVTDDRIENFGQAKRTLQKRLSEFSESPNDEDLKKELKSEASPAKKAKKDIPEGVPKSVYRQMKEFLPSFDAHVSKVDKIFDLSQELFTKELLSKANVQKCDLAWELCEWLKQGARVGHKCTKPSMDAAFSSRIILELGRQFTTCPVANRTYKVHDFASRLVIVIGLLRLFQLRRENHLSFDETNTWGVPVPLANSLWYIFNGENPNVKRMSVTSNYKLCCFLIISILALAQAPAWSFEFIHLCEDVPTMKDKELFQTLCFCGIKVSGGMEKLRGKLVAPLRPIMLNQAADSAIAAEREAQIDSLVKRLAEQRQVEQELRIDIENLEAERSREAEEARSRLAIAENETRSWQRQHEEANQRIQQLREERKKADEEHAERLTAASEKSEKLEREIEVLRKELRESEVRLQNESRERAALARAVHAAEDRLGSSELQASQLRADLDEICRENSELKDRYMTAGERFERLMESEEEHTKELTRQLEEEVRAAREKADRYKSKLQKSQNDLEQLRDSLSREQSKTREREREVDRLMRMVEDERTAKEKTLAELSREDTMPLRVHEQIVADMRHQAAQQLDDKQRSLDEQWQRRLSEKLEQQKNETSKAMDRIREGIKDLDKQKDELKGENGRLKDDKRQLQEHITTLVDKLEKVDRQRQLLEGKVDEVTDQLERNKEMYTVEMNRGLQYQGEVSRLQRVEHRQEQQVDDLKAEVLRLRQTHSDAEKILQESSRLKGEVTSLTDTVKALEQQRVDDRKQIGALQKDLRGEKARSSRLGQAAATAVSRLDEQVRALRPDLLALRSDASTDLARTADWITARLRELTSEFGSATHLQLTRHAVMFKDVSSRLEESQNRGAKLREELKGLRAANEQRGEELASLRSKESSARAELAAAREHIAAMVGMMDRIMKMPDGEKMGEELADALGKSDTFRHVLSRYDGRVTRRVSALIQEAQGEADALAASCLELEYRCKKAEAEFRNQASVRSSLETMATQRSAELEGALERAKVLEGRCRDLEKSAEEAQAEFHDKLHTAVRRTKDALRAEIDELQAQMLDLRRQFEVEVARVSEEAA
ncbi:hypothetical protein FOL46_001695 [Perkinsus olseni]|uniref:Uncharacterized protein n=1 Tax=Perkinsus olseni TaxID=32597 RepID=A0A7J6MWX6_PEROL|nr:hypothetical protein FOL46_001695 [Perkinsus olseni]